MLDKEIFKKEISILVALFPTWNINVTDSVTMAIWYDQFKDVSDNDFSKAVKKYSSKEKFNPTVAGIFEWIPEKRNFV